MPPEQRGELGLDQKGSGTLGCCAVCAFCNTVLVRLVWLGVLPLDAVFSAEVGVLMPQYSPPLSSRVALMRRPRQFSAYALYALNAADASLLRLR